MLYSTDYYNIPEITPTKVYKISTSERESFAINKLATPGPIYKPKPV